jgi:hypothetical protein
MEPKELGVPEISACPMWSLWALMSLGALILGMPCSESFIVHKAPAMYAPYTFHICTKLLYTLNFFFYYYEYHNCATPFLIIFYLYSK